ncbi:MAG TPA: thioredoxin family protein [Thermodesulfobacteriota bacterium]|nr:thioredoxin family protein [Thermodesulfobacteriota bacterium]
MISTSTRIAVSVTIILFLAFQPLSEAFEGAQADGDYREAGAGSSFDKVEIISEGRLVDLIEYLVPGKYTAFYFYAEWCGPCRILKPRLEKFVQDGNKLVLRELNIINWENPLVTYYKLPSIPYFIIYGPDGKFVERGPGISNDLMKEISSPD